MVIPNGFREAQLASILSTPENHAQLQWLYALVNGHPVPPEYSTMMNGFPLEKIPDAMMDIMRHGEPSYFLRL